jgi:hypothetical protein
MHQFFEKIKMVIDTMVISTLASCWLATEQESTRLALSHLYQPFPANAGFGKLSSTPGPVINGHENFIK